MDEMEAAGYNTQLRRAHDGDAVHDASYVVDATDSSTGDSTTIRTVKQWQERK
jgi:predicted RNA-binding protein with TRAM domain